MTRGSGAVIAVGRLNPPTRGHGALIKRLREEAAAIGARPIIYIVDGEKSGKDRVKNPLTADQRLALVRRLFPDVYVDVVGSAYQAIEVLDLQELELKVWVAGSDRASNYQKLLASESIEGRVAVVDREAGEADGISATAARLAALRGDDEEFSRLMPEELSREELAMLSRQIREVAGEHSGTDSISHGGAGGPQGQTGGR